MKMGEGSLLLGAARNETYGTGDGRVLQFLDVLNDGNQDGSVLLLGTGLLLLGGFQLFDFARQFLVGGQQFAELNESPDDQDAHPHGTIAFQHG